MVAGGVAAAADAEAAAAARPVEVATERGPAWAAMPTPTATPTTAGAPPAVTPAAAAKPQSAASGASSSSSVKMRKPEEGAWGSNKKSKGAQPTLAYRLYRSTGSDSLTLQLEHLAARDKLLAIFNVSESTVEVRVKRRPVLPQQPLLLHSGGGFEAHETNSWREEDHLTSGPLALHKLGSEWALDGKELGKASGTGESDATSYEIGRSKLVTHRLLHVADGGGGAQLTVRPRERAVPRRAAPSPPPPPPSTGHRHHTARCPRRVGARCGRAPRRRLRAPASACPATPRRCRCSGRRPSSSRKSARHRRLLECARARRWRRPVPPELRRSRASGGLGSGGEGVGAGLGAAVRRTLRHRDCARA